MADLPRVVFEVGHGIRPDGTYDPGAGGEWDEQSAGDVIVRAGVDWLHARGFNVWRYDDNGVARITRRADNPVGDVLDTSYSPDKNYQGTPTLAKAWGATHVVAIHHDWHLGIPAMFGFWTSSKGQKLADDIRDAVVDAGFPHRADWHKHRGNLGLINGSERRGITATLIEVGRIGQDEIDTDDERRQMGRAIALGIARALGVPTTPTPEDEGLTVGQYEDLSKQIAALSAQVKAQNDDWLHEKVEDWLTEGHKGTVPVHMLVKRLRRDVAQTRSLVLQLAAVQGLTAEDVERIVADADDPDPWQVDLENPRLGDGRAYPVIQYVAGIYRDVGLLAKALEEHLGVDTGVPAIDRT